MAVLDLSMLLFVFFFFFNDTATTEIYTLSLHDALPSPISLTSPSTFEGIPLRTLAKLELRVDPAIASQPPFDALRSPVTQDDFPAILAAIREQNRREFGSFADRPDS